MVAPTQPALRIIHEVVFYDSPTDCTWVSSYLLRTLAVEWVLASWVLALAVGLRRNEAELIRRGVSSDDFSVWSQSGGTSDGSAHPATSGGMLRPYERQSDGRSADELLRSHLFMADYDQVESD